MTELSYQISKQSFNVDYKQPDEIYFNVVIKWKLSAQECTVYREKTTLV